MRTGRQIDRLGAVRDAADFIDGRNGMPMHQDHAGMQGELEVFGDLFFDNTLHMNYKLEVPWIETRTFQLE
jgi:hypothetical protein